MVRVRARTADGVLLRGRRVDHRAPDGIPGLFRDQRRRTPDAVACSDPYRSLRYLELDQLSDELAATLLGATGGCRAAAAPSAGGGARGSGVRYDHLGFDRYPEGRADGQGRVQQPDPVDGARVRR